MKQIIRIGTLLSLFALAPLAGGGERTDIRWRYGFPRSWSYSGRATYQGKQVWEIKEINPRLASKANFHLIELPRTAK